MNRDRELDQLLFVFERHRDIELEAGYVLAGILVVDLPKPDRMSAKVRAEAQQMTSEIILQLSKMAASGYMPEDAKIFCWKDGKDRPDEITEDAELMRAWRNDRLCIGVRTSKDGKFAADSGMMQAAGLMPGSGHA
jgi:hypothetical protein